MAVTSAERQWRYEAGEIGPKGWRFTCVWQVKTSDPEDGILTVLDAQGIPNRGDAHPTIPYLPCDLKRVRERRGPCVWLIEVVFEWVYNRQRHVKHPLDRPVEGMTYFAQTIEPIDTDADGNPICNSAGEGFDPPLQEEFSYRVYEFSKNYATFSDAAADVLIETLNAATWNGWTGGTCRMKAIGREPRTEEIDGQEVTYQRVTYRVHARKEGWKRRVVDQGYRDKNHKEYVDPTTGQPSTRPHLLDGAGNWEPGQDETHWLEFVVKEEASWADVPLPP